MLSNYPVVRVILYILSVVSTIVSFFVTLYSPDLAVAFVSTAGVLNTVSGVTALSNVPTNANGKHESQE